MNKIKEKIRNNEGFTLLEVMISLSVLAVGILGVIGMFVSSIEGNSQGRNMTEASNKAQSKLDYLANARIYESLENYGNFSAIQTDGKYTIVNNITTVGAYEMKKITVTVSWTTKGTTHQVEMASLRAKN